MIPRYIRTYFSQGHERTIRARKNIAASLIFRGITIALGFFMVPLSIDYLDATQYGIYLIVASVAGWFSFFDIGLGHGLRNKLAVSLAGNNIELSKVYVSTAYCILGSISLLSILAILLVAPFVKWSSVFNAKISSENELTVLVVTVFSFFLLRFVLELIISISQANQVPMVRDFVFMIAQLIAVSAVFILIHTDTSSLLLLAGSLTGAPVLALIICTFVLFRYRYRNLIPSLNYVDFKYGKELVSLGLNFFLIRVATVVLFMSSSILIAQLFTPKDVTAYQLAYKFFQILLMIFMIVVSPMWSAVTDAYHKNDYQWIKESVRRLLKLWGGLVVCAVVMLAVSGYFFTFWLGDRVSIPYALSLSLVALAVTRGLGAVFTGVINGIGKLRVQQITAVVSILFNIPLGIFFARYCGLGVSGIVLGTLVVTLNGVVFRIIQYRKLVAGTATGIWNK